MALVPDFAPLWLPDDEAITEEQAAAQPADRVDGWSWPSLVLVAVVGSRSKTVSRVGFILALLIFALTLPTLARGNAWGLARLAIAQATVIAVMLVASRRTRSVSVAWVIAQWLVGFFLVALVADIADALVGLIGLDGQPRQAVRAVVMIAALTAPLIGHTLLSARRWQHPGASDLMVLGAAIGSGFGFHEDGLLDITRGASLGDGHPAVWMALIGLAVGLIVLERHDEVAVISAALVALLVVGDATVLNLRWLPTILAAGGLGAALLLDRRRLDDVAHRDHLFPDAAERHHDVLVARYRRLRNGVHTTVSARGEQWPPSPDAPIAELARAARAAALDVGRETSRFGWDRNPDDRTGAGRRFFGPNGWTPFTVDDSGPGESPPRSRPDATTRPRNPGQESPATGKGWKQDNTLAWVGGAVLALVVTAALTASFDGLDVASLAAADPGPPTVRTVVGAIAATAAAAGRGRPELGQPWELGPPDHHEV